MAWHFYVVLVLLSMEGWMSSAVEYKMDGVSYIVYSFASKETSSPESQSMIHMLFRTAEPSGLLIHGRGKRDDFVTVEVVRGKLRSVKQKQLFSFYDFFLLLCYGIFFLQPLQLNCFLNPYMKWLLLSAKYNFLHTYVYLRFLYPRSDSSAFIPILKL